MKRQLLSALIAVALSSSPAWAASPTPEAAAKNEATRAEIDRLVARIQELSSQLDDADVQVKVMRIGHDAPHAPGQAGRDVRIERRMAAPRIGIGIVMSPSESSGVRIAAVTPEGPAAKAGLKVGDVLVSVDGKAIAGSKEDAVRQARTLLSDLKQGQAVKLGYLREGTSGSVTASADTIRRAMFVSGDAPMWSPGFDIDKDVRVVIDPTIRIEIDRAREGIDQARAIAHAQGMTGCAEEGKDCHFPALAQALRWNGLNLASVDARLGRYFGTDRGVLVLGSGEGLPGLEPGDVIQRIDGEAVGSPRDAMRALRQHAAGEKVKVDVLRDRKARSVEFNVPQAPAMRWLVPPAPPAPPAPPMPPAPPKTGAPPAPPATPTAPAAPPPPPAPPAPPQGLAFVEGVASEGVLGAIVSETRWQDDHGNEQVMIEVETAPGQ